MTASRTDCIVSRPHYDVTDNSVCNLFHFVGDISHGYDMSVGGDHLRLLTLGAAGGAGGSGGVGDGGDDADGALVPDSRFHAYRRSQL